MNPTPDSLVEEYLDRLDDELSDLPRARRRELVQEISEHVTEARAELPAESGAGIRNLLDRLGDPADIAADARERFGVLPKKRGLLEIATLVLLLVGGVVLPVIGWLVGVVLLWVSSVWSTRDKLIGTLVVPGGLALPLFLTVFAGSTSSTRSCVQEIGRPSTLTCSGTSPGPDLVAIAGVALLALAPLVTTAYLARRSRSAPV